MMRHPNCSLAALAAIAFAAGGALPVLATGEPEPDPPAISKEVTSGPCLDDPSLQCPRTDVTNISIDNHSFEDPVIPEGTGTGTLTDWDKSGSPSGTFHPDADDLTNGAPDGNNTAFAWIASISQTLSDTYIDGATCSLSVWVCDRDGLSFVGYDVELHDDGGAIPGAGADETDVLPANDDCAEVTVVHTVDGGDEVGDDIKIVLSSDGNQTHFDNVTLTQSIEVTDVVSAVPVGPDAAYEFDFTITVENATPDLLVLDTLPAEWVATTVTEDDSADDVDPAIACGKDWTHVDGNATLTRGGKPNKKCQSATEVDWEPADSGTTTLKIDAMTRESPGESHSVQAPCGNFDGGYFEVVPENRTGS